MCDLTNAAIVQLNGVTGSTLTVAGLPVGFGANAYVMPSRHVTYYVTDTLFTAQNTNANTQMLMMSINGVAQPLAEGVEDLQIAYGFDNNGDGIIQDDNGAGVGTDEWLFNAVGETIGTWPLANLRRIRVTLIVKSTSIDTGQTNFPGRPKAEDHAAGTATDGFVRRVLRTEIAVRNFTLNP